MQNLKLIEQIYYLKLIQQVPDDILFINPIVHCALNLEIQGTYTAYIYIVRINHENECLIHNLSTQGLSIQNSSELSDVGAQIVYQALYQVIYSFQNIFKQHILRFKSESSA